MRVEMKAVLLGGKGGGVSWDFDFFFFLFLLAAHVSGLCCSRLCMRAVSCDVQGVERKGEGNCK